MFLPQLVNPDNAKQRVGELTLQFSGIKIELQMEAILQCASVQGVQLEKVSKYRRSLIKSSISAGRSVDNA